LFEIKLSKDRADKEPTTTMDHKVLLQQHQKSLQPRVPGDTVDHNYVTTYYTPDYSTIVDFGYTGGDVGFSGGNEY
jgi:hypothetical protein